MPFTAAFTFGADGDALPDAGPGVTVSIANAAGLVIASGAATVGAAVGGQQTATFIISAALTPLRDLFTCTWTATYTGVSSQLVSTIDVCDSRLFPLSDYAQFSELSGFTTAQQETQRLKAEDFLERECNMAFTGRYYTRKFTFSERPGVAWWPNPPFPFGSPSQSYGQMVVNLDYPFVQAIRSITQTTIDSAGTPTVTIQSLLTARLDGEEGVLYYQDSLGNGLSGDVVIGYEHGQKVPDVGRIALILARYRLLNGPLDARAVAMPGEGGGSIRLLGPGGGPTGIDEVDTFLARFDRSALGFVSGS